MTPAKQIKAARRSARLTQAKAAEHLGMPVRTLQEWEQGRRVPSPFTLRSALRVLTEPEHRPARTGQLP